MVKLTRKTNLNMNNSYKYLTRKNMSNTHHKGGSMFSHTNFGSNSNTIKQILSNNQIESNSCHKFTHALQEILGYVSRRGTSKTDKQSRIRKYNSEIQKYSNMSVSSSDPLKQLIVQCRQASVNAMLQLIKEDSNTK